MAMKKVWLSVCITTVVLVIYTLLSRLSIDYGYLLFLFISLHFLLFWMVLEVLIKAEPSAHTFDERFYDDEDYGAK